MYIFPVLSTLANDKQDSVAFKGQLPVYAHFNPRNDLSLLGGARYIPQLNYSHRFGDGNLLDFEASLNMYGNIGMNPFDSVNFSGVIKPYRLWARYSTNQLANSLHLQIREQQRTVLGSMHVSI